MKSLRGESLIFRDVSGQSSKRRKYTPHALPVKITAENLEADYKLGACFISEGAVKAIDTAFGGELGGNQRGRSEKRR
jgi:hypothetical protein